ncbi:hypothetical protein PC115_g24097 [Phytophthora cactorum]|uniref:Uncharacterized protein n=1 Tax=Phytophthora cactorum TaxID=29920 RepID=A0A8T1B8S8_9STRA|nr:hypothetical protein PC115_g24097 [Phytophthora cactorum]KAG2898783.1 hypothetical protein PC117_g22437 [Phytophthora cactorum]
MTKAKGFASNFSPADLANKLKGKLNNLQMKSPKLANTLNKATDFTHGLMADLMSDAMFTAAMDMLSNYSDGNIVMATGMLLGVNDTSKKNTPNGKEIYGPYYEEAKRLFKENPEFFGDPDNHTVVEGKGLEKMRKEYDNLVRQVHYKKG